MNKKTYIKNSAAKNTDDIQKAFAKTPNLGFLLVDKNGIVKFINKKFEKIFGLASKACYESKFDELVSKTKELRELFCFLDLKNSLYDNQDFIILKDKKYFRLNISKVLEGAKKFDGFIVTVSDTTHEKELEKKEMEHERMLISNAKMAVVGEMINSISHQQRQPLSSVLLSLGNIEECIKDGEFGKIEKHLLRAKNALNLMNETIKSFRSFYKNDNSVSAFSVKDVINELVFIVKPQMNTSGIFFEFICDKGDFIVKSVPGYVKQILLSLLSNAKDELLECIKKDDLFEPKIILSLKRSNDEIHISVIDNGAGVKTDCERIFEPFYTTKKDTGTGMGLYVAKILAEDRLGGRIVLASGKNPTEFSLILKANA